MSMGQFTLQLLEGPTWEAVHDRLLMVMHPDHPEHVTDELVEVRLALYSRPETTESLRRYYQYSGQYGYGSPMSEEDQARLEAVYASLPVLIIGNDADGQSQTLPIPGAQHTILKNTGIWAHWEAPDEFNELVERFITSNRRS
jgi:2-hydroxy-6-oxonona-2,4-dienedioate hydrolase